MGVLLAGSLVAQAPVPLARETPFLNEPRGIRLMTLQPGVRVTPRRVNNDHAEVTIQGWIYTPSTKPDRRDGFDLSVGVPGGENLRTEPNGQVLGRAVLGALFDRVASRGGWTQVRRTGWVPRAAVIPPAATSASPPSREPPPAAPAPQRDTNLSPPSPPSSLSVPSAPSPQRGKLGAGATLAHTPEGAATVTLNAPADVTITERDRDWVRVQVSGWVLARAVSDVVSSGPAVTAAMLRENPERYIGRTVEWRLQFLAHQQADELRLEMPLGTPYLLARGPLPESGFVYVMISKEQAERLKGLKPLDEFSATVTVRAGRTRYLPTPVVELVRIGGGESRTP